MPITIFLEHCFGPDNPNRFWLFGLLLCVLACFPRASRRAGGIGLCVLGGMMSVSLFIHTAVASNTPVAWH